jgi:hypothetical protein
VRSCLGRTEGSPDVKSRLQRADETVRHRVTALDRLSTACFTVGVLAPVAGAYFNLTASGTAGFGWCCVAYFVAGGIIHLLAMRVLRGLRE